MIQPRSYMLSSADTPSGAARPRTLSTGSFVVLRPAGNGAWASRSSTPARRGELLGGVQQAGRDVERVADIGDLAPHVADLAGDDLAVVNGRAESRHRPVLREICLATVLDDVAGDEGAAQAFAVGEGDTSYPGEDGLVADVFVDLRLAFEGGVGDISEEVIQQLVELHRPSRSAIPVESFMSISRKARCSRRGWT